MFGMGGTEILLILVVALIFLGPDKLPEAAKSISKGIRDIKKQSRVLQRTIEEDEHIGGAIRDLKSALRGEDEPYRPPRPRRQLESTPDPMPESEGGPVVLAASASDASGASDSSPSDGASDGSTAEGASDSSTSDSSASGSSPSDSSPSDSSPSDSSPSDSSTSDSSASGGVSHGATATTPTGFASAGSASVGSTSNGAMSDSTPGGGASVSSAAPSAKLTFPPTAGEPDDTPAASTDDADLAALVKPVPNTVAHTTSPANKRKHG